MKERLLILHPYLAPYRLDLYNRLAQNYELFVFLYGSEAEKATLGFNLEKLRKAANFHFIEQSKGLYWGRHLLTLQYHSIVKRFRPDIVITHELGLGTIAMTQLAHHYGFRQYVTIDDSLPMAQNYSRIRFILRKWVYRRVDGVLVVNNAVRSYLENQTSFLHTRFFCLPIIQDDHIFEQKVAAAQQRAAEYKQLYSLGDKKIILFVARMIPLKRPEMLISTFLSYQNKDAVLVMVGNGELYEPLRSRYNQHPSIIFQGALSGTNLYAWFHLANLLVLPSNQEAFGAVVNEALISGCRVLVSDCAGANMLINEENGSVFATNSQQDFNEKFAHEINIIKKDCPKKNLMIEPFDMVYQRFLTFIRP